MLIKADNQPISARFGDAVWITEFITPDNPDVRLKYEALVSRGQSPEEVATSLWRYVVMLPYTPAVPAIMKVGGRAVGQRDTWFFPREVIQFKKSNCANKSFLMTSLLKNYLPSPGQVFCTLGVLNGIGNHAWVETNISGKRYIIETTQPRTPRVLIPAEQLDAYDPMVYFDETSVYATIPNMDVGRVVSSHFGVCAIPFLNDYLCQRCLELEGV